LMHFTTDTGVFRQAQHCRRLRFYALHLAKSLHQQHRLLLLVAATAEDPRDSSSSGRAHLCQR
jgi:hypothetical protein